MRNLREFKQRIRESSIDHRISGLDKRNYEEMYGVKLKIQLNGDGLPRVISVRAKTIPEAEQGLATKLDVTNADVAISVAYSSFPGIVMIKGYLANFEKMLE